MLLQIRHGETDEDKSDNPKFSGPGDVPLNSKGKQQATDAGEFLKKFNIAYLLTSPIPRAKESAKIIGDIIDLEPKVFDLGRDWNIGQAAGRTLKDILPFIVFFERNPDLKIPGGDPYGEFWETASKGQDYLLYQPFEDINIALVTHSRFIAVSKMRIDGKGMEPTDFSGSPKPGGVVGITRDPDNGGNLKFDLLFGSWNGETR